MPGCAVDPHTHNHRRHTILDNDPQRDVIDVIVDEHHAERSADHASGNPEHVCYDDCPPVTVADLLDAWYAEPFDGNAFATARARASDDVRKSWARLFWAIEEPDRVHALSPSERAEFDRRTT